MTGVPSEAFSRARWKISRMCRSVSPTNLLSSSGPLMLRKYARPSFVVPAHRGDLLGQRVGHRLGDQRLAAAGRAVEQHALRRPQLVLAEQLGVQERQLDGVADLLDLPEQAADVAVVDVGHLLQHEVLDLGLGHPLVGVARLGVDQQRVARLERTRSGSSVSKSGAASQTTRSSSACPTTSARPPLLGGRQHLAQRADLADALELAALDDGERLVQPDGLAAAQRTVSTAGETATRMRRPEVNTSTVSSGNRARKTP